MSQLTTVVPPPRRPELLLKPLGNKGQYVLKDPLSGTYFQLGEHEYFLLSRLDGQQSSDAIRAAFKEQFGEPLSEEELQDFLDMARAQQFLHPDGEGRVPRPPLPVPPAPATTLPATPAPSSGPAASQRSILYWRKALFDPDRLFNWLEPRIRFVWTRGFVIVTLLGILVAAALAWANGQELVTYFATALRWETFVLMWLTLLLVTLCHEFAHGLTCKHYGGEVHEIGFLLLFLMPSLYCNVTDAWLFPEKRKRLLVTLAGGYCDLVVWSLAVFTWRLTAQDTLLNYMAWVLLSVVGARIILNLNPLLKLDGYYLLSDLLEIPNLQQRGLGYMLAQLRRLLWGAAAPEPEPRAGVLLAYGLASWLFSLVFLTLMLLAITRVLMPRWGLAGLAVGLLLGYMTMRGLVGGVLGGEVREMLSRRHKRALLWAFGLVSVAALLCLTDKEDQVGGLFTVRAASRAELRALIAGFLQVVYFDEGQHVDRNALVARLEMPSLTSRITQKQAELREARAQLRLLEIGPRPEELAAQQRRVERAQVWRELADKDLQRTRHSFDQEVVRLDKQIVQYRAESDNAQECFDRASRLVAQGALPREQYREAEKRYRVARAELEQVEAQKRGRQALSTQEAEAELVRREKELAEAQATLTLLEAGTRPEEIEGERARLARLEAEAALLAEQQDKLLVRCPVAGIVATARLRDRLGQYFHEGDLIAEVEDPGAIEAEIALEEQDVAPIRPGAAVELKVQALPYRTFHATVERVAPRAVRPLTPALQNTVTVYCRVEDATPEVYSGMTGHARIACGRKPLGKILAGRLLRFVRTEFWW